MPTARSLLAATLTTLVLSGALAGCIDAGTVEPAATAPPPVEPLTEAFLGFGEFLSIKVAAEDGVLLHVDVQLPEGEGPFPLLLEYTPYSLLGDEQWAAATERGLRGTPVYDGVAGYALAEFYVPRGYAVGVAHVRGTGESGGCLTVGGPEEGRDGYALVEALASEPWSNGKVALMGTSYVGTTPIETAIHNPPHLTTIIPVSAVTEWYRYYFEHGEQRMNGSPPPGASYPDPALWLAMGVVPGARTGAADPEDASCVLEYTRQFWLQDDYSPFWEERNLSAHASNITVPVLYVQGWKDENVATSVIPRFWSQLQAPKKAWFMQVQHGVPRIEERAAYYEYEHRWLDHHMLGRNVDKDFIGNVVIEDNRGQWRMEADWPPADSAMRRFWLGADGTLADASGADGSLSYVDEGASFADLRGVLRGPTEGRAWLRFEGPVLEETMHLAGEPVVHLEASSSLPDTQFTVLAYDVDADGSASFVTRGYLDARHRESLQTGKDLAPGERYSFEWPLHPRDHVLEAGHRLVVVVKSSDPYVLPDATRATNTIHFGAEGSWLDLPLIPEAGRQYSDAAPQKGA